MGRISVGLKSRDFADAACWPALPLSSSGTQPVGYTRLACVRLYVFLPQSLNSLVRVTLESKEWKRREEAGFLFVLKIHPGEGQGGSITSEHKQVDLEMTLILTLAGFGRSGARLKKTAPQDKYFPSISLPAHFVEPL